MPLLWQCPVKMEHKEKVITDVQKGRIILGCTCARAELALHLSLPLDYGGPGVVNFEREGISTTSLEKSPKERRLKI